MLDCMSTCMLVGGLEHEFYFPIQLGIRIPTDFHVFQSGRHTTNQYGSIQCIFIAHTKQNCSLLWSVHGILAAAQRFSQAKSTSCPSTKLASGEAMARAMTQNPCWAPTIYTHVFNHKYHRGIPTLLIISIINIRCLKFTIMGIYHKYH